MATVVYLYLSPEGMWFICTIAASLSTRKAPFKTKNHFSFVQFESGLENVQHKLRKELSPDARVISHMFKWVSLHQPPIGCAKWYYGWILCRIPGWDDELVEVKGATSKNLNRLDVSNVARLYRYRVPEAHVSYSVKNDQQ